MATKKELVTIKPIEMEKVKIHIVGDTPLIMHAWSTKAKQMMLDAQTGKAKGKAKPKKRPCEDFIDSMYWMSGKPEITDDMSDEDCEQAYFDAINAGAKFCFPVTAFKQAAISAAYRQNWSKDKVSLRGSFFIEADANVDFSDFGMVEIKSDMPVIREDMVRIGMGTADIRYRGQFNNWSADLTINYNKNGQHSLENIINMINAGGILCGVGEWRPEKDGDFGRFHVATEA